MKHTALFFCADRALVVHQEREQGTGTRQVPSEQFWRFGVSPCTGSRHDEFTDRVLACVDCGRRVFLLRQASRCFSTTNSLRTTPTLQGSARRNVCGERRGFAPKTRTTCSEWRRGDHRPLQSRRRPPVLCRSCFQKQKKLQAAPEAYRSAGLKSRSPRKLRREACGADQCGKLRPMTLLVEQRMGRDFLRETVLCSGATQIRIENIVGCAPVASGAREQVAEDFRGLEMKVEERVEWTREAVFPRSITRQARKTLRPKQIHYPNVSDKLLYVVRPPISHGSSSRCGVGVEVRLPVVC